ncbi:hypothetical protein ZWY2020_035719 [Hordeum vulgare]|nr:hypothetical protein ZWY2020_035719 [Hordeum vulgare]
MAPKTSGGKGATSEKELARLRKKHAIFRKGLDMATLKSRYQIMWAAETKAHPATEVLPGTGSGGGGADQFPFFADYFFCGLYPPFSEFFLDLVHTYGFLLLDFTPNAVTCMSIFVHLCENFVGITPNTALFRHYFAPRIQGGEALLGSIAWVPRTRTKEAYLGGTLREKWDEWRGKWCWIRQEGYPPCCEPMTSRIGSRGEGWSDLSPDEDKMSIATTRILRLRAAGLTLEMVAADFLRRRITPSSTGREAGFGLRKCGGCHAVACGDGQQPNGHGARVLLLEAIQF